MKKTICTVSMLVKSFWRSQMNMSIRIWGSEPPEGICIKSHSSPKVNVWAGFACYGVIGPYLFEEDIVKAYHCLKMLKKFLVPHLKRKRKSKSLISKQDGAPPHYTLDVREFLDVNFKGRWICRISHISWVAMSPDISPLVFFLRGCRGQSIQVNFK